MASLVGAEGLPTGTGAPVLSAGSKIFASEMRAGSSTGKTARNIFRHGGFLRQITLGHSLQLIHQTQNGRLVCVIHTFGFLLLKFSQMTLFFN